MPRTCLYVRMGKKLHNCWDKADIVQQRLWLNAKTLSSRRAVWILPNIRMAPELRMRYQCTRNSIYIYVAHAAHKGMLVISSRTVWARWARCSCRGADCKVDYPLVIRAYSLKGITYLDHFRQVGCYSLESFSDLVVAKRFRYFF